MVTIWYISTIVFRLCNAGSSRRALYWQLYTLHIIQCVCASSRESVVVTSYIVTTRCSSWQIFAWKCRGDIRGINSCWKWIHFQSHIIWSLIHMRVLNPKAQTYFDKAKGPNLQTKATTFEPKFVPPPNESSLLLNGVHCNNWGWRQIFQITKFTLHIIFPYLHYSTLKSTNEV